ncbi:hypothetical protein AM202_00140 [Actinobacillus minor 202]|uniref:Lipoprotein n=2 Tax=Actinobacillus TaxID=713 RepID=A0ABY6TJ22_9PAST|nr:MULTISPECIES: hypothetical protein [Actinobacillus]EEV24588.1 hypothetical protein AM202_00140 [Actinobacillus minor 202]VFY92942.1 Uncharacterised protein [Actinobacillus porcinus]VTU07590.1 Uncharacterised protein [Actinobacillus porcinus]
MKKLLIALFSTILLCSCSTSSAKSKAETEANTEKIVQTVYVLTFKGKDYYPEKAKTLPDKQNRLLEKIVAAKKYDNAIAKQFKDNSKLVPFNDLFEEHHKVFKNNDVYLHDILENRNYNAKILDAYLDYYQNMLNNFKQNRDLFAQRSQDKNMLKKIDKLFNQLNVQQKDQSRFFNQLQNLRGL